MRRRIVTIIEEYCDDDSDFQDLTLRNNGAGDRLLSLKGGQVDREEIHTDALAAQGGKKELAASPEEQGATEGVVEQRAEVERLSPSSTNVDVTIQPQDVREDPKGVSVSRLASIKSWFANLGKSAFAEFVKQLLPLTIKTILRLFGIPI